MISVFAEIQNDRKSNMAGHDKVPNLWKLGVRFKSYLNKLTSEFDPIFTL